MKYARSILAPVYRAARRAVKVVRREMRRIRALPRLRRLRPPHRLHLGCGTIRMDGWVNMDLAHGPTVDIAWDFTDPLPFTDGSCSVIFHEHVLEHLAVESGVRFLAECRRVLKEGGVLRIAMPSLDWLLEACYTGRWRDADWLSWPQYQFVKSRAEMTNMAFRNWGHQWLYDREELHRRLGEAGFEEIRDVAWGESAVPELRRLESRKDSILICEAVK